MRKKFMQSVCSCTSMCTGKMLCKDYSILSSLNINIETKEIWLLAIETFGPSIQHVSKKIYINSKM